MHVAAARIVPHSVLASRFALPVVLVIGLVASVCGAADPAPTPDTPERLPPNRIELKTGDRHDIVAWHYPLRQGATPAATVILIHDLGGSHETVDALAVGLQEADYTVIVPDLRGHGESVAPEMERAAGSRLPADLLKRPDFLAMVATGGGRVRNQATLRGDVEAVRKWIADHPDKGVSLDRLYVVGSGLGAAVAAYWTNGDAAWPPITSGPQGGDVKGLVLIEPALATKGFQIRLALDQEPVRTKLPVMVVAGPNNRDADKVCDQLKKARPDDWFDSRLLNRSPAKQGDATFIYAEIPARDQRGVMLTGDAFASFRSESGRGDPAFLVAAFIKATSARSP